MASGRFAPSPTGDLHLGNLRTALLAWLFARSAGSSFLVRMEDLDTASVRAAFVDRQLADLSALGLDWDGPVVHQSARTALHHAALDHIEAMGVAYPCFCTRREVREAASAPHGAGAEGAYPGTCRDLDAAGRARRAAQGRAPALRLRGGGVTVAFADRVAGPCSGVVDDIVLRRGDGTPAYNLAVVVDDAAQGVEEVVRGDDLLPATPAQAHLAGLLGLAVPTYAHVPLALGPDGSRLAKRHGAVTVADLAGRGLDAAAVRGLLATSLGLAEPGEPVGMGTLLARFDPAALPHEPWVPTV